MDDDDEADKANALLKKIFVSLVGAFLAAWGCSSLSFWANNGMSLFDDIAWALIGGGVGMVAGWRIGGKL